MTDYTHPLTAEPREERDRDETHRMNNVDVTVKVSPDGKRVDLTVIDQDGEETTYDLAGFTINGVAMRPDGMVHLYGVDAVIEWQNAGLGLYPAVNIRVTRD